MENDIKFRLIQNDEGEFEAYDCDYDITISCKSKEDQDEAIKKLKKGQASLQAATADSGWLTLPLSEGIEAYNEANTPQYRKIGKLVIIRGTVKGVTARNTVIGNLPVGYRPTKANPYVQNTSLGSGNVATQTRVTVTTTGDIKLEAISSDAVFGADKWFPIATMFLID